MDINEFGPNLSFFFSNGLDPEYAVIGRVARRIWAKAMKHKYGADAARADAQVPHPDLGPVAPRAGDRFQRHPHHAPGALRDLRQLQLAPHERLRRGDHDARPRSPSAGRWPFSSSSTTSWVWRRTRTRSRDRSSSRSSPTSSRRRCSWSSTGSPSAAECSARWRPCTSAGKIQEESLYYETLKHTGEYPIIGVNTFLSSKGSPTVLPREVIRSTEEEREQQIRTARSLAGRDQGEREKRLRAVQTAAIQNRNIFEQLVEACKISHDRAGDERSLRGGRPVPKKHVTVGAPTL